MATLEMYFTVALGAVLTAIAVHDLKHFRIPDHLSLFVAFAGMVFWSLSDLAELPRQIFAACAFGGSLWLMRETHARLTGRIGLGLGDVKLAAAGAIWLNPVMLPMLLFVASLTGLVFASATALAQGGNLRQVRIAFAPFLGGAILFCWMVERIP